VRSRLCIVQIRREVLWVIIRREYEAQVARRPPQAGAEKGNDVATSPSAPSAPLRLAELVAALSLATDLGTGQPMEHALRTCLLAIQLGGELGVGEQERCFELSGSGHVTYAEMPVEFASAVESFASTVR
jgi:hypothetical protein